MKTNQWVLKTPPQQNAPLHLEPNQPESTFELTTSEIDTDSLSEGGILVKVLYLSNDPAQKDWLNPGEFSYADKLPPKSIVPSISLVNVVESNSTKFQTGDYLFAFTGWATYYILKDNAPFTKKLDPSIGIPLHHLIGSLGGTGLTAYFALHKYAELDEEKDQGKTFLITGAAGGVGSMTVALASGVFKAKKIFAIVGGPDKVKYVESLGPSVQGIDYKDANFKENLTNTVGEDGIDIIVDNVGGEILDLGLTLIKKHGKVVLVGATSGYFDEAKFQLKSAPLIIFKSLTLKGFIVFDNVEHFEEAIGKLVQFYLEKKIDLEKLEFIKDAKDQFDQIPKFWYSLFSGLNKGKFLTKVNDI